MSHLGKRRNIFKRAFKRGYVSSEEGNGIQITPVFFRLRSKLSCIVFTARLMNPNFCYAAWVAVAQKSGWKGISWTLLGPVWMSFPVMFLMLTSFLLKL